MVINDALRGPRYATSSERMWRSLTRPFRRARRSLSSAFDRAMDTLRCTDDGEAW
jgi:hypothetical protein